MQHIRVPLHPLILPDIVIQVGTAKQVQKDKRGTSLELNAFFCLFLLIMSKTLSLATKQPLKDTDYKYDWNSLNSLQIGSYAEYFTKMEFTLYGFDVYTPEVDDKGIDFIARMGKNKYYDIHVKSISEKTKYIFFPKDKFELRKNLLASILLFKQGNAPKIYLIPSLEWNKENTLFRNRNYDEGQKSKPEWGLNLSPKNYSRLEEYTFDKVIAGLTIESKTAMENYIKQYNKEIDEADERIEKGEFYTGKEANALLSKWQKEVLAGTKNLAGLYKLT